MNIWKRTVVKNENKMGYTSIISTADDEGVCEVGNESHARLIAAAPELLSALKRFVDYQETGMPLAGVSDFARSAISKAEAAK